MDYNQRKDIAEKLRAKLQDAQGPFRESLEYKIAKLEQTRPANSYSMATVLSADALNSQFKIERRLLAGYNKILKEEPDNMLLEKLVHRVNIKLYHLERETHKQYTGAYTHFVPTNGMLVFTIKKVELDPCNKVTQIDFYVNKILAASRDPYASAGPIEIQLSKSSTLDIVLLDMEKGIVHGIVLLPCDFFVNIAPQEIVLEFNTFNFVTFAVSFQRVQVLHRSAQEFCCLVIRGHTFDKSYNTHLVYCNVCSKRCSLFSDLYACIKCKVRCHVGCVEYILFGCRAHRLYGEERDSTAAEDACEGFAGGGCSAQGDLETVSVRDLKECNITKMSYECKSLMGRRPLKNIKKGKYDITHTFEKVSSGGIRFCKHCGERIKMGDEMLRCEVCKSNYHASCRDYLFNSCGIEHELRVKMVEFQHARIKNIQDKSTMRLEDFTLLKTIGRGSFGKVLLAENKSTGSAYALKIIKKQKIYSYRDLSNLESEKEILRTISDGDCPFLTRMHFCFQDKYRVYIGLDYEAGGELHRHLFVHGFTEAQVRFYTAEIIEALEFLHRNNIAYRDLKLDNILLTGDGHIKLCDFGLSKTEMGASAVTYTYCGSLDTVAPEILDGCGYSKAVDFWALGIVVYEMFHREPPFCGANAKELVSVIASSKIVITADISPEAKDFIHRLLIKEPSQRLGHGSCGLYDIKAHYWFRSVDWSTVSSLALVPEFVPGSGSKNLDPEYYSDPPVLTPTISVADIEAYIAKYE